MRQKVTVTKEGTTLVSIRLGGDYGSLVVRMMQNGRPIAKTEGTCTLQCAVPPEVAAEHPEWSAAFPENQLNADPSLQCVTALPPVPVKVIGLLTKRADPNDKQIKVLSRVQIEAGKTAQVGLDFANQAAVTLSCVTETRQQADLSNTPGLQLRIVRLGEYAFDGKEVLTNLACATIGLDPGRYRFEGEALGFEKALTEFTVQANGAPQKVMLVIRRGAKSEEKPAINLGSSPTASNPPAPAQKAK